MSSSDREGQLEFFQVSRQPKPVPTSELGWLSWRIRFDQVILAGIAGLIGLTVVFACGVERGKHLARSERPLLGRPLQAAAQGESKPTVQPDPSTQGRIPSGSRGSTRLGSLTTILSEPTAESKDRGTHDSAPRAARELPRLPAPRIARQAGVLPGGSDKPRERPLGDSVTPFAGPTRELGIIADARLPSGAEPTRAAPGRYAIQVVTYSRPQLARQELARLQGRGETAFLRIREPYSTLYIGPFPTEQHAREMLPRFRSQYRDCFIRTL